MTNPGKKNINSWEIAKLAGVSRSTVSRVINNYPNVPESTREKVMAVIRECNYYPDFSAQVLSGKGTGTIGLFWISHGSIAVDALASSFMARVIEDAAELDFLVLTCVVPNLTDPLYIDKIKRIFLQRRVDGGVFIGASNNEPLIEELIGDGKIIGLFDHYLPGRNESNRIVLNFERNTGEKAIDYLASLGHRKIAILDGDLNRYSSFCRHEGFLNGMRKHSIEIRGEWIKIVGANGEKGYDQTTELIARSSGLPTALCCNNDSTAFYVINALNDAGLSVPGDISVIGIDDHTRSADFKPPLTTFRFDFREMFMQLTKRLITEITNPSSDDPRIMEFYSEFVERDSCRRL